MNNNHKQDSLKDMIDILKQDYKSPTKMWIWAVALKEWAAPPVFQVESEHKSLGLEVGSDIIIVQEISSISEAL